MKDNYRLTPAAGLFLAGVFLCSSCSPSKPPVWLKAEQRIQSEFIHGFAKVSKTGTAEDYIGRARTNSLGTIAQAIKSDINVSSVSKVKEIEKKGLKNEYFLDKSFEMISSARSKLSLEGVEHIGEWEDENYFYVYNRLSKMVYREILNRKISKALESAGSNYEEGINHLQFNPVIALKYFLTGLKSLIPYQDQILIINDPYNPGEFINLDLVLRKQIEKLLTQITLTPHKKNIKTNLGQLPLKPLELKVRYKTSIGNSIDLNELPVIFKFSEGNGSLTEKMNSDKTGNVQSTIQNLNEMLNYYQIKAELDMLSFTGDDEIGIYLYSEFKGPLIPTTFFNIKVKPITLYLISEEKSLGKTLANPIVTPIIIKSLEEKLSATFINEKLKSDYTLDIKIDTQKRGEAYSLFSSVAQMSIYFKDGENILFANNFNDIKGTHSDYEKASREALKKLAERVEKKITDEIVRQIMD
jgi:hypothetical protein